MDFSSANVPISRETWAPRDAEPSPAGSGPERAQPAGSEPYRPPQSYSSRSPPRGPAYDDRSRAPPSDGGRRDDAPRDYGGGGGGYQRSSRPSDYPPPRPRQNHAPVAPNNVLGVFGLSVRTNERDLEDEFGRYGEVEKAVIVYDQKSDRSRGFGFVTMRSVEDAQRAMESLNGTVMNGRPVRVDFSATQRAHNPTPGQYKGERKPGYDDSYSRGGGYGRDRYDDRRPYDSRRDRYDDRDRERAPRRDHDDYRRRDDRDRRDDRREDRRDDRYERKRSLSPVGGERRARQSPAYEDRRPAYRDQDEPVPKGDAPPRY